jgi:ABC-2 type transport system ATP-binding protein
MPAAIEVQNLQKTYRDGFLGRRRIEALRGISFAVQPGEIFGLLGPNGAGKTTLIKVLLGVVRRTSGEASLLGRPAGDRVGRRGVGYLPENHRIPRHHTGNTALAYYGGLSGLSGRDIRQRSPQLLETVGLTRWGNTPVRKYSKGMLQRLGLAQALLHDPQVLILDEPTDGVDPVGRSEMRVVLQQLKTQGKTVFINSHLLQEVELVCDRVAILNYGQVLREGNIAELTRMSEAQVQFTMAGPEAKIRAVLDDGRNLSGPPNLVAPLRLVGDGQYQAVMHAADQGAIDRAVDELRRQGVSIVSIVPNRQTLEEAFLNIVRTAGNVRPGAA